MVREPPRRGDAGAEACHDIDARLQKAPNRLAHWRNEQQNAENIGQEARQEQQDAGDQDHRTIGDLAAWIAAGVDFRLGAAQDAKTLDTQQNDARDTGQKDQADGRQNANLASYNDESRDFGQRPDQKKKRKQAQLSCRW